VVSVFYVDTKQRRVMLMRDETTSTGSVFWEAMFCIKCGAYTGNIHRPLCEECKKEQEFVNAKP
jgi:hypothetical protein